MGGNNSGQCQCPPHSRSHPHHWRSPSSVQSNLVQFTFLGLVIIGPGRLSSSLFLLLPYYHLVTNYELLSSLSSSPSRYTYYPRKNIPRRGEEDPVVFFCYFAACCSAIICKQENPPHSLRRHNILLSFYN